jgi:hypothetical protein
LTGPPEAFEIQELRTFPSHSSCLIDSLVMSLLHRF